MRLFNELDNSNFELFAAKYYQNPCCLSTEEFYDDLAKFKYVVRLLRRYRDRDSMHERLLLNHITLIYNVFQIQAATRMLFYRVDTDLWPALKTFLVYLNYLPNGHYQDINIDLRIAQKLNEI